MRFLILAFGTALALAACGKSNQAESTGNFADSLTADNIVSNDVTAIDAVTGDAANMAADVDYSAEADNEVANEVTSTARPSASTSRPRPVARTVPAKPAEEAASTNSSD